jgi:ribA/ribD-fused uncharacterized protein
MGTRFPSVEHAYQAAKFPKERHAELLVKTSSEVKKLGYKVTLPHDWEDIKFGIMQQLVAQKFDNDMDLNRRLFDTGTKYLEERNDWKDKYWGTNEQGVGENNLGKILMEIRAKI